MHSSLQLGLLYLASCISNVFANPGYQTVIANPNDRTPHQITLKIAADDYSEMWFVGDYYGGSVADGKIKSWEEIRTYQKTVYGPGPWLIAVKVYDFGGNAGLFASTLLDGTPYSTTASPNNKFRMTPNPPLDSWNTDPRFDEKGWVTQLIDSCSSGPTAWPKLYARLETALSGEKPRAMWFPECKAVGTPGKPKEMWFRLVVTANNVIQKRGLPGQPTYGGSQQSAYAGSQQPAYAGSQQSAYAGSQQPAYAGSQQSQFPMLGGQGYDNDNDNDNDDNDNDNDNDDDDLGYTGNNNQGSSYTPNSSGGYNGSPQAGQSQTAFSDQKTLTNLEAFQSLRRILRQLLANGPWQIAIYATDTGWVAGMFATVWVDDKVFSTTAQADNKFRMSKDQQGPGWDTSPYFFEGKWKAQTEDLCAKRNYKWSSFHARDE
ncbi:hypothetical protein BASA60_004646 [Batrachochytrium salamandrivorans]|nr:hypothetical protein BASA60_004646 [Batrachochytrium salamandrivorans]